MHTRMCSLCSPHGCSAGSHHGGAPLCCTISRRQGPSAEQGRLSSRSSVERHGSRHRSHAATLGSSALSLPPRQGLGGGQGGGRYPGGRGGGKGLEGVQDISIPPCRKNDPAGFLPSGHPMRLFPWGAFRPSPPARRRRSVFPARSGSPPARPASPPFLPQTAQASPSPLPQAYPAVPRCW